MKTNIKIIGLLAATSLSVLTSPVFAKEMTLGLSVDQLFESRVGVTDAIKAEAERQGYKVIEVVADGDAQAQNSQIQSLVTQKVDAILVCAVDQNTIERALIGAKRTGIPIVAFDRALPNSRAVDAFVGPDSITDGYLAGEYTANQFKDSAEEVVILELLGALNDQNGIDRSKGFNDAINKLENVKVVAMPTDWDSARALSATQNAFQANPNIKAVFAATDTHIPSVETVLNDLNKMVPAGSDGHVVVTGVNGSNDGYQATVSGSADGIVVMDLETTGITTVKVATALLNGEQVEVNNVIPGNFYTTDNIAANKANIWGAK
ncbi:sugar ABC transporter substrate-binding protein [Vibrio ulleungensis]|uniref:Autoinducer 2-binding periplasmic protein LuxP n=1 Tax=Vibrio ulleungensis TaxID=2807619 RepID=A0ABS2HEU2_9VIBR|nr:sugar ABC transporter substrate-binding protein [Vibrio ulleungensis]MBM7036103.1 sugar ABC transporter substrate-binding protein [Vibrio ulleungensis]